MVSLQSLAVCLSSNRQCDLEGTLVEANKNLQNSQAVSHVILCGADFGHTQQKLNKLDSEKDQRTLYFFSSVSWLLLLECYVV